MCFLKVFSNLTRYSPFILSFNKSFHKKKVKNNDDTYSFVISPTY